MGSDRDKHAGRRLAALLARTSPSPNGLPVSRAACWLAIDSCTEIVHRASEGRVVLVLLAKYPLDHLGTILGATFCERFDQTGRAVLHRLRGISPATHSAMPSMLPCCTSDLKRRWLLTEQVTGFIPSRSRPRRAA